MTETEDLNKALWQQLNRKAWSLAIMGRSHLIHEPQNFAGDVRAAMQALTALGLKWDKDGRWIKVNGWALERLPDNKSTPADLAMALVRGALHVLDEEAKRDAD